MARGRRCGRRSTRPARSPASCPAWCRPPPPPRWNSARPAPPSRPGFCRPSRPGRRRARWSGTRRSAPAPVSSASISSGTMIQAAMPMKARPSTQRITSGPSSLLTSAPTAAAKAWLAMVAARMPNTIGSGRRKRAASRKASNWVLSPISARATMPVETRKASIEATGREKQRRDHSRGPRIAPTGTKAEMLSCSRLLVRPRLQPSLQPRNPSRALHEPHRSSPPDRILRRRPGAGAGSRTRPARPYPPPPAQRLYSSPTSTPTSNAS
jgi:hypothetical protein